jgi:hypothetical protein
MSRRSSAHAGSKKAQAKKARRKKRQVARDSRWIPDTVLNELSDDIELAAVLEGFDERITQRGWVFDEEASDEESALWAYPPSASGVVGTDLAAVTTIVMTADDGAEIVHVVFVGTADDYQFEIGELFDNLDVIEAYRPGEAIPEFD